MSFQKTLSEGWGNLREQLVHRPLFWMILAFAGGLLGLDLIAAVVVCVSALVLRCLKGFCGGIMGSLLGFFLVLPSPAALVSEPFFHKGTAQIITIPRTQEEGFSSGVAVGDKKYLAAWKEDWGVSLGDVVQAEGWIKPLAEGSEEYLRKKGFSGLWTIKTRPTIEKQGPEIWKTSLSMRRSMIEATTLMVRSEDQALVDSMCFNHYAGLDQKTNDSFGYSGLKHLMAASGSTVLIISAVLLVILRSLPLPRWTCLVFSLVVLCLYAGAASLTAAAIRSVLMLTIVVLAEWLRRPYDAISTLSFVAIVALILDPGSLQDAGFQVSYACSLGYGIVVQRPRVEDSGWIRQAVAGGLDAIRMSAFGWLLSTPILAYHFHYVALGGIPASVLALVPYTVLVSAVFSGWVASLVGLSTILPWLGKLIQPCIDLLRWIAETMSHPSLTIPVYEFSVWWLVIGYGTAFLVWAVRNHSRRSEPGVRGLSTGSTQG